ncbi:chromate transporter [uncultured Allofournierella sp.]|uniref:chromate transporter n=1 Tax=uncultured Allofournierella sp. TaxID=1940258 RepID=UPI0025DFAD7E|nr:chromate transporter [uncultured Fournierella sp.]
MILLLRLYWEFFKTGLFAVGGGLATLPFLSQMADKTGWFTQGQLMDMVAVSESTPGPIGINTATYVGFTTSGVPGALAATLGLVTPSILIILAIASFLKAFRSNRYVDAVFRCLRPASTGLIAASGLSVAAITFYTAAPAGILAGVQWKAVILAVLLLLVTRGIPQTKKLHPVVWIALSALAGIVFSFAGV